MCSINLWNGDGAEGMVEAGGSVTGEGAGVASKLLGHVDADRIGARCRGRIELHGGAGGIGWTGAGIKTRDAVVSTAITGWDAADGRADDELVDAGWTAGLIPQDIDECDRDLGSRTDGHIAAAAVNVKVGGKKYKAAGVRSRRRWGRRLGLSWSGSRIICCRGGRDAGGRWGNGGRGLSGGGRLTGLGGRSGGSRL